MDGWMSYMGRWQEYQINGWKGKGKRKEKERLEGTERERRAEGVRERQPSAAGNSAPPTRLLSYLLQLDTVLGGMEALAEVIYFSLEECPHFTEA